MTGGQGERHCRDLTAGTAVLQLILSGHVDTTDYTNQSERERERMRERERTSDVKFYSYPADRLR